MTVDVADATRTPVGSGSWTLRATGLSMTFGATRALRDVDLTLRPRSVHALLGKNGCGKSTLVKILAGYHAPDEGTVEWSDDSGGHGHAGTSGSRGRVTSRIAFVHQDLGLVPNLSVAENLGLVAGFESGLTGIRWREQNARTARALDALAVSCRPEQLVGELGPVEQTLVAVVRALAVMPETGGVLVLDEPTARLPAAEARRLVSRLATLREHGTAILYISHRLEEVEALADEVSVLRDGAVVFHGDARELDHAALTSLVVGEAAVSIAAPEAVATTQPARAAQDAPVVLSLESVSCRRVKDATLSLRRGELVGVAGLVGSGRSELGRLVFGLQQPTEGRIALDGVDITGASPRANVERGIGYVPQERRSGLFLDLSVESNAVVAELRSLMSWAGLSRSRARHAAQGVVDANKVRTASLDVSISTLSGGNQQKVALGKWMRRDLRLLVLDEPTQGIDVVARAEIFALIRAEAQARGLAVLVLDSDVEILTEHCDRVVVMNQGRLVHELAGDQLNVDTVNRAVYGTLERN